MKTNDDKEIMAEKMEKMGTAREIERQCLDARRVRGSERERERWCERGEKEVV